MILKESDNKAGTLDELQALLNHPKADASARKRIEQELRNIRAGQRGENEASYEIKVHFGPSDNWVVIHDLRIEHDGLVAQIDHLLINRLLEIYVCESKHFSEGISINDHGEFTAFYAGKAYGVPSPIEQNRRHITVLRRAIEAGAVVLPKRLGFTIRPDFRSYVLVSKGARITRPKVSFEGLDAIVKNDQLYASVTREEPDAKQLLRLIGIDTLRDVAQQLVKLHRPIAFNWKAKFGLAGDSAAPQAVPAPASAPTPMHTEPPVSAPAAIDKLTTAKLAAARGLQTKELLDRLVAIGHLELRGERHYLTANGKSAGGEWRPGHGGGYMLWPSSLALG